MPCLKPYTVMKIMPDCLLSIVTQTPNSYDKLTGTNGNLVDHGLFLYLLATSLNHLQ